VFIRAIKDQDEIQHLYQESQARRGDEIAYELRRDVDWSSKTATRGHVDSKLHIMVNFQVTDDGGIQDVDFRWAKSVKQVRLSHFIPIYFGQ